MNALIDTNVVIDVLTRREPHFADSLLVLDAAERGEYVASICATTVTTIFYILRRSIGAEATVSKIKDLSAICHIAPVNLAVIESALHSKFRDFEDAVMHHSAILVGADCIVTRNESDFRESSLLIYSPKQFLAALEQHKQSSKLKEP